MSDLIDLEIKRLYNEMLYSADKKKYSFAIRQLRRLKKLCETN